MPMADGVRRRVWLYRGAFIAVALFILFLRLLPLGSVPGDLPGPDLLLCVIMAWVMRRPDFLPVLLIAGIVFLEDVLLMRPLGLWTALVVLATEFLRSRAALTRELSFAVEWMLVAGLMIGLLLGYRLFFALSFLPQPGFGFALTQTLWSILCYPLVVMASRLALDLRKPALGELDDMGRRL
jgi:rod shape-determining protein MreD